MTRQQTAVQRALDRQNLPEVALVGCLQGHTSNAVLDVLLEAVKHKDGQVRWAAIEGLKHFARPAPIPVFIAALSAARTW